MDIWKALNYLLKQSVLYKDMNIQVDTIIGQKRCAILVMMTGLVADSIHNDSDFHTERQDEDETDMNQIDSPEGETCSHRPDEDECDQNNLSDDDGITFNEENEDNLETCGIDMDTMLDDCDPIVP